MPLTVTTDERAALHAAQVGSRKVRHWRRLHAVVFRADGVPVAVVAQPLGVSRDQRLQRGGGMASGRAGG